MGRSMDTDDSSETDDSMDVILDSASVSLIETASEGCLLSCSRPALA